MHLPSKLMQAFTATLFVVSLSGCGEKTVTGPAAASKLEQSQDCFGCHGGVSKITGETYTNEWLRSAHNTKNGAGC
ncbi:MAG: cytochrome C, partial [Steroidobacteraceae bacterium]|nr:cytochrome C [Deltaproteobacteria bacterium]